MIRNLRLIWHYTRFANKSFWRNPVAAVFAVGFPVLFLVINSALFGDFPVTVEGVEVPNKSFYVPGFVVFAIVNVCFTNLATTITNIRDFGALKRIAATPTPVWIYIGGRIVHSVFVALLVAAVMLAYGRLVNGTELPTATMPAFVLTIILGAATFSALGLAVVPLIPNPDAAAAITNIVVFPLLFISNIIVSAEFAPGWLSTVSRFFPLRPFADAAQSAFFGGTGSGFAGLDLLILATWGAAGALLAARFFTWQPHV